MTKFYRPYGTTQSEQALQRLCTTTFLRLWSYANPFRDQGRRGPNGNGKELCDLLVVFGENVIIFSDKSCEFPNSGDVAQDWSRWHRRAIAASADQIFGAERWLRKFPTKVYLDPRCGIAFPFPFPETPRFHRIVVATGSAQRAAAAGQALGLFIAPGDKPDQGERPFCIGRIAPARGHVHVFDEFALFRVVSELSTVDDLIRYLDRREQLIESGRLAFAPNESALLAIYLSHTGPDNKHDFPPTEPTAILGVEPSAWEDLEASEGYRRRLEANRVSYVWDGLIEHFTHYLERDELVSPMPMDVVQHESILREMAAENRLARRHLGKTIVELRKKTFSSKREFYIRTLQGSRSNSFFVIFVLRCKAGQDYQEYRRYRQTLLALYAKFTVLRVPSTTQVVALGFDPAGPPDQMQTEDMLLWRPGSWDETDREKTRQIAERLGVSLKPTIESFVDWEFDPQVRVSDADRQRSRNQRKRERKSRR